MPPPPAYPDGRALIRPCCSFSIGAPWGRGHTEGTAVAGAGVDVTAEDACLETADLWASGILLWTLLDLAWSIPTSSGVKMLTTTFPERRYVLYGRDGRDSPATIGLPLPSLYPTGTANLAVQVHGPCNLTARLKNLLRLRCSTSDSSMKALIESSRLK